MTDNITLPAPDHPDLIVTTGLMGELIDMAWNEGADLPDDQKAETTAMTKAQMFTGGRLCLPSLIALHAEYERMEDRLLTECGTLQKRDGFQSQPSPEQQDAWDRAHRVQAQELRARAWLSAYPSETGIELAHQITALIHPCGADLNGQEHMDLLAHAKRLLNTLTEKREAA